MTASRTICHSVYGSGEQFKRVTGYIQSGIEQGARATRGGEIPNERGYFVQPTVFTDTRPEMKIVREEIFGGFRIAKLTNAAASQRDPYCDESAGTGRSSGLLPQVLLGSGPMTNSRVPPATISL